MKVYYLSKLIIPGDVRNFNNVLKPNLAVLDSTKSDSNKHPARDQGRPCRTINTTAKAKEIAAAFNSSTEQSQFINQERISKKP